MLKICSQLENLQILRLLFGFIFLAMMKKYLSFLLYYHKLLYLLSHLFVHHYLEIILDQFVP